VLRVLRLDEIITVATTASTIVPRRRIRRIAFPREFYTPPVILLFFTIITIIVVVIITVIITLITRITL